MRPATGQCNCEDSGVKIPIGLVASTYALFSTLALAQSDTRVHGICTVRDAAVRENDQVVGTIYRSTIFSAPVIYDADISLTPERGGSVSAAFERWVYEKYGFRPDRVSLGDGAEHYCVEAPFTETGEQQLVEAAQQWSMQHQEGMTQVFTEWTPAEGKRVGRLVPPSGDALAAYKAAVDARKSQIEADQTRLRQAVDDARTAVDTHAAELEKADAAKAEYERQREAYREEYKRITGQYPPG